MIAKIRINNFYSVGLGSEISFLKKGIKSEDGYLTYKKDNKISLLNGFFGANASGKTTVLKAMTQLIRNMYNTFKPDINNSYNIDLGLGANFHDKFKNLPTKIGMDFLFDNNYYIYDIEVSDGVEIVKESLTVTTIDLKSAKPKVIFSRDGTSVQFGPEYKKHNEDYFSAVKVEKYQTFVSYLIRESSILKDFSDNKDSFFLKPDMDMMPSFGMAMFKAFQINIANKKDKDDFLSITTEISKLFDPSIQKIDTGTKENPAIKVTHKDFYKEVDIQQESAGTKELFCYIYDILKVIKIGGVVIYDETNRYYHPDIEMILLSLFKNKNVNVKNAQLFFASHNHETFDLLELDQSHIVEKQNSETVVFKLSEVEDLKRRDNLKKKYRMGMFGGIPDTVDFEHALNQQL